MDTQTQSTVAELRQEQEEYPERRRALALAGDAAGLLALEQRQLVIPALLERALIAPEEATLAELRARYAEHQQAARAAQEALPAVEAEWKAAQQTLSDKEAAFRTMQYTVNVNQLAARNVASDIQEQQQRMAELRKTAAHPH